MILREALVAAIEGDLRALRPRLGPEGARALDDLLARRGILVEDRRSEYFHPLGQPVVELPAWVAAAARRRGRVIDDETISGLAVASLVGYLHVRVHDDFFDERREQPEAAMVLAAALLVHHQGLLLRHAPAHAELWRLFEALWLDYGEAMLLEHRLVARESSYDRAGYDAVLRQARPLVLPGAAVLARTDLWDWLPPLERFVAQITLSAQLYNDVSGAADDLQAGRYTWVVRRLGGLEGAATLRRRLFFEGGLDELVGEASRAADAASVAAQELGMDEAVTFLELRKAAMKERSAVIYRSLFSAALVRP